MSETLCYSIDGEYESYSNTKHIRSYICKRHHGSKQQKPTLWPDRIDILCVKDRNPTFYGRHHPEDAGIVTAKRQH